jgi:hypothetical protein
MAMSSVAVFRGEQHHSGRLLPSNLRDAHSDFELLHGAPVFRRCRMFLARSRGAIFHARAISGRCPATCFSPTASLHAPGRAWTGIVVPRIHRLEKSAALIRQTLRVFQVSMRPRDPACFGSSWDFLARWADCFSKCARAPVVSTLAETRRPRGPPKQARPAAQ